MDNPIRLVPCSHTAYTTFAPFHYDSEVFQKSADCWIAMIGDRQVGFCAAIANSGRRGKDLRPARFAHKTVAKLFTSHPEYFRLWARIADAQAEKMLQLGYRFWSTSPADHALYRDNSASGWIRSSSDGKKVGYRSHQYVSAFEQNGEGFEPDQSNR
jgi:hypothetical protein